VFRFFPTWFSEEVSWSLICSIFPPIFICLFTLQALLFAHYTFPYSCLRLLWVGLFSRESVIFCTGTDSFSISTLIFNDFCLSHIIEFCCGLGAFEAFSADGLYYLPLAYCSLYYYLLFVISAILLEPRNFYGSSLFGFYSYK